MFKFHVFIFWKLHNYKMLGEKPFKCDQCSFSTAQKVNLITHKALHTGYRFLPAKQTIWIIFKRRKTNKMRNVLAFVHQKICITKAWTKSYGVIFSGRLMDNLIILKVVVNVINNMSKRCCNLQVSAIFIR